MFVSQAIAELRDIDALDLTETEALRLLNEANQELCVRSRWTRATKPLGPSVPGQAAYTLAGTRFSEPLEVYVGGVEYHNSDRRTVSEIQRGDLRLRADGLWFLSFDADGAEAITLYPGPATAGVEIDCLGVYRPEDLATTEQFTPPADFHRAIVEYVQAVSIGGSEDDTDRRQVHFDYFEREVARLRARRITRSSGRVRAQLRITGVTA